MSAATQEWDISSSSESSVDYSSALAERDTSISNSDGSKDEAEAWACEGAQKALASLRSRIAQNDDLLCGIQSSLADALADCHTSTADAGTLAPLHDPLRVTERETGSCSHGASTTESVAAAQEPFSMRCEPPKASAPPCHDAPQHPSHLDGTRSTEQRYDVCGAATARVQVAETLPCADSSQPALQQELSCTRGIELEAIGALRMHDGANHGRASFNVGVQPCLVQQAVDTAQSDNAICNGWTSAEDRATGDACEADGNCTSQSGAQFTQAAAADRGLSAVAPLSPAESGRHEASMGSQAGHEEEWMAAQRARAARAAEWRRQQADQAQQREAASSSEAVCAAATEAAALEQHRAAAAEATALAAALDERERQLAAEYAAARAAAEAELAITAAETSPAAAAASGGAANAERALDGLRKVAERLAQDEAARAAREQELEAERRRVLGAFATQQIAAGRIQRAWRAWAAGSGRVKRKGLVVRLQAALRGWLTRRQAAAVGERKRLVAQAEACLSGESQLAPAAIQTLRCSVERAGLGAQAEQLQHFFSAKRAETVRALALAARHKGQVEYVEARNAARRFHDELETDLRDAARIMMERQTQASAAVANAAHNCEADGWSKAIEHAVCLGLSETALQPHRRVWQDRQKDAGATLAIAAEAEPFCRQNFEAAAQAATALGLKEAVGAAEARVQTRIRDALAALQTAQEKGVAAQFAGAVQRCAGLGLQAEVAAATAAVDARRGVLQERVMTSARHDSMRDFQAALMAAGQADVPEDILNAASACFQARSQKQAHLLAAAVGSGSLREASAAAHVAQSLGLASEVSAARAALARRYHSASDAAIYHLRELTCHLRLDRHGGPTFSDGHSLRHAAECAEEHRKALGALSGWARACLQPQHGAPLPDPPELPAAPRERASRGMTHDSAGVCSKSGLQWQVESMASVAHAVREASNLALVCLATALLEVLFVAAQWQLARLKPSGPCAEVQLDYDGFLQRVDSTSMLRVAPLLDLGVRAHVAISHDAAVAASAPNELQQQDPILAMWRHSSSQQHAHVLPGVRLWMPEQLLRAAVHAAQQLASTQAGPGQLRAALPEIAVPAQQLTQEEADHTENDSAGVPLDLSLLQACAGSEKLSNLSSLSLAFEGLSSIDALSQHCRALHTLSLCANCLRRLDALRPLCGHLRSLDVSENGLCSLGAITALGSLQHLNVDRNGLKSLAGLERLTELRVLNAAHNSLLTVDAVFSTDHPLACLNLSGNCLTSLAGLVSCSSLLQADVSRNLLTHLQPLAACSCLQELWASENRITSDVLAPALPPLLMLQDLRLSGNCITAVEALPWLPHLTALSLSDNPLQSLGTFALQPRLSRVDVSFCQLQVPAAVAALHGLSRLTALQLNDNRNGPDEITQMHAVLAVVPWLRELNHEDVPARAAAEAGFAYAKRHHGSLSSIQRGAMGLTHAPARSRNSMHALRLLRDCAGGLARDEHGRYRLPAAQQVHSCCCGLGVGPASAAALDFRVQLQAEEVRQADATCRQLLCGLTDNSRRDRDWTLERLCDALELKQRCLRACRTALLDRDVASQGMFWRNHEHAERIAGRHAVAARALQRAWRARGAAQARRHRAAAVLQAIARGAVTRRRGELQARRNAACAARGRAVCIIQAACRGHLVRARLGRARAALRCGAGEWDTVEDDDLGLDDMLAAGAALGLLDEGMPHAAPCPTHGSEPAGVVAVSAAGVQKHQPLGAHGGGVGNVAPGAEPLDGCFGAVAPNLLRRFNAKRSEAQLRQGAAATSAAAVREPTDAPEERDPSSVRGPAPPALQESLERAVAAPLGRSPSPGPSVATSTAAERKAKRVQQVQQEWGFADAATAEAYLRRQRRQVRGGQSGGAARSAASCQHSESTDPLARLEQFRGGDSMWPVLRERGRRHGGAAAAGGRGRQRQTERSRPVEPESTHVSQHAPAAAKIGVNELPALRRAASRGRDGDLAGLIGKVVHRGGAAS